MKSKILWLDSETTGTDPMKNDVVQLACLVEIDGNIKHKQKFKMRPINGGAIDPEALELNGLTQEEIARYPTAESSLQTLKKMLSRYVDKFDRSDKFVPAGFHVKFDLDFLRQAFLKTGDQYFGSWIFNAAIDVQTFVAVAVARYGVRVENFKLSTLCARFGVPIVAHEAMSDIEATRALHGKLGGLR